MLLLKRFREYQNVKISEKLVHNVQPYES